MKKPLLDTENSRDSLHKSGLNRPLLEQDFMQSIR